MAGFYGSLTGIPIDYLVSTPLMAAARSNIALAQAMQQFVMEIAFVDGNPAQTQNIVFNLVRPYTEPLTGNISTQTIQVTCPLLGLVPIPALLVDNVTIDFTTSIDLSSATTLSVGASATAGYNGAAFTMSGGVTASADHMRSSNQSATYTFHVAADQQPATEGMNKLMDVMASCIVPIPSGSSSSSSAAT